MEKFLALVFVIKESNYDRPYLVEENVMTFRKGLAELLNATMSALNWRTSKNDQNYEINIIVNFIKYNWI